MKDKIYKKGLTGAKKDVHICSNTSCGATKPGNISIGHPNGTWKLGLCHNCYTRFKRTGTYERKYIKSSSRICVDCENKVDTGEYLSLGRCIRCYRKFKYKNDIQFRLRKNLRNSTSLRLKLLGSNIKLDRTINLLGCTIKYLIQHLSRKFTTEMSWENYGKVWQIDHIIPLASFDLSKKKEQLVAFNFSNLQPLLTIDNMRKGDILPNGKSARNKQKV